MKLWNLNTGRLIKTLNGHSNSVFSVAIDPTGRYIVSGSYDQTLKLWDLNNGKLLASFIAFKDASIAITENNYFDGTGNYEKYIRFVDENNNTYPYNDYAYKYHKPKMVQASIAGTDYLAKTPSSSTTVNTSSITTSSIIPIIKDTSPPKIYLYQEQLRPVSKARKTIIGRTDDKSGVAIVYVNNKEAQLDDKGKFKADILLKPGVNNVIVQAIDIHNNKTSKIYKIKREFQSLARPFDLKGKYYGFLIGINNYKYLKELETPVNDVIKIKNILKNDYGFETDMLLNQDATRKNIVKGLNLIREDLTSDDKLLIYYAGHGYFDEKTKKAYWLPVNAEENDNTEWIIVDTITSNLTLIPANQILIVSDSCYSGTLKRAIRREYHTQKQTREQYLKSLFETKSRILISSGGNEPVADTGTNGHSVFANVFINGLKKLNMQIFTAGELFINYKIKERVSGKIDQTPEHGLIKNSGHDDGDFVFIKRELKYW
ncbi:metacaspase-1 [Candidatus Magnetomoraceae bacterium gMMP-13]